MADNGGNGNGRGSPWWVNAIAVVGVPSIIALLTVNWILNTFSSQLLREQQQVVETQRDISELIQELHTEFATADDQRKQQLAVQANERDLLAVYLDAGTHSLRKETETIKRQTLVQQQTCVNQAKSLYQARKCMEPGD